MKTEVYFSCMLKYRISPLKDQIVLNLAEIKAMMYLIADSNNSLVLASDCFLLQISSVCSKLEKMRTTFVTPSHLSAFSPTCQ